jgi:hypothetical protein
MQAAGAFILGRGSTGRRATADDSTMDLVAQVHGWGAATLVFDFKADKSELTDAWSDSIAFIGRLPFPKRCHQWICAAYRAYWNG